jgi:hypothetical protein
MPLAWSRVLGACCRRLIFVGIALAALIGLAWRAAAGRVVAGILVLPARARRHRIGSLAAFLCSVVGLVPT